MKDIFAMKSILDVNNTVRDYRMISVESTALCIIIIQMIY